MKFTQARKSRPLDQLFEEMKNIIVSNPTSPNTANSQQDDDSQAHRDALSLVGKHISHKFVNDTDQQEVWYEGFIVGYDVATKMHEVAYVEEEDHCHFDLTNDLRDGDLIILHD